MADLVPVNSSQTGAVLSPVAANADGDLCPQAKRILLLVINGGENACDVTVHCQRSACGFPDDHDKVTSVAAGASKYIGPFNKALYNDTDAKLEIKYSQVDTVTIAALEVNDL